MICRLDDCPTPHCHCNRHTTPEQQTCPSCIHRTRTHLTQIRHYTTQLPNESETKGINSEATNLNGPAADPEAWSWRKTTALKGVRDHASLTEDDDPHHPKTVLGTWEHLIRDHYDQPTALTWTIDRSVDYLTGRLAQFANDPTQDFPGFAAEVRQCHTHLEAVLHDGEQRDTGAPCMTCRVPLERVWGKTSADDGWICRKCRQTSTDAQYRFAVQHLHREEADELTDREMEILTGIPAGTIRVWARRDLVARRTVEGRVLYSVADVQARRGNTA